MHSGNGVCEQIQDARAVDVVGEVDSEARNRHSVCVALATGNVCVGFGANAIRI